MFDMTVIQWLTLFGVKKPGENNPSNHEGRDQTDREEYPAIPFCFSFLLRTGFHAEPLFLLF
jgi:hypothetical protein